MTNIVLLAGPPGSGKSFLASQILARYPDSLYICLDDLKEYLYDIGGFYDQNEKGALDHLAFTLFYQLITIYHNRPALIILDYPFGQKHLAPLQKLNLTFNIFTIRLTADFPTLYARKVARKADANRHQGHKALIYYAKDHQSNQYDPELYSAFVQKCHKEQYANFSFNKTMVIDTTNFEQICFDAVDQFIAEQQWSK